MHKFASAADTGDFSQFEFGHSQMRFDGQEGKGEEERDRRAVKLAESKLRGGHRSKAAKILSSDDVILPQNQETFERFRLKFPRQTGEVERIAEVTDQTPFVVLDFEEFGKCVKKSINGSSGGISGLTSDQMKPILHSEKALHAIYRVVLLIANGQLPPWMHPYLAGFRGLALGEKARPICIGEWILRLTSICVLSRIDKEDVEGLFLGSGSRKNIFQFGTAIRNGQDSLVHTIDTLMHHSDKERICLKIDFKNAFNSIKRAKAVNRTVKAFPATHRFLAWLYQCGALIYMGENSLEGEEGLFQGECCSSVAFDAGLHPALIAAGEVNSDLPDVDLHVLAQRDDVYLVGGPRDVFASLDVLTAKATTLQLELQKEKSRAYAEQAVLDANQSPLISDFKKSSEGLIVVGTPVGKDEYVSRKLGKIVNKHPSFFRRLKLMDPQCGLLLLRECGLPMATWITRTVDPRRVGPFARIFDERVIDAWKALVSYEGEITDDVLSCLTLPFREGGCGLRSMEQTSPIAHYASVVGTYQTVGAVSPELQAASKDAKEAITGVFEAFADANIPLSALSEVGGEGAEGTQGEREQTLRAAQYAAEQVPLIAKLKVAWNTAHTQIFKRYPSPHFPKNFLQILTDFHPVNRAHKLQSILTHSVAGDLKLGLVGRHRKTAEEARGEVYRINQLLNSDNSLSSSQKKEMKKQIEKLEDTEKAARETVARITSQSDSGSSLAHTALPTSKDLILPPSACQITEKIRAGVLKLSNEKCTCKGGEQGTVRSCIRV
ncbi:MAG: reverse transcriptase domain-containing protein [Bacteroidota bacterium]